MYPMEYTLALGTLPWPWGPLGPTPTFTASHASQPSKPASQPGMFFFCFSHEGKKAV